MDATVYTDFDDCVSNVCQNETVLIVDSNLSALHSSCATADFIFLSANFLTQSQSLIISSEEIIGRRVKISER